MLLILNFLKIIFSNVVLIPVPSGRNPTEACRENGCVPVMATSANLNQLICILKEANVDAAAVSGWNGVYQGLVLRANGALAPYDPQTNNANAAFCYRKKDPCLSVVPQCNYSQNIPAIESSMQSFISNPANSCSNDYFLEKQISNCHVDYDQYRKCPVYNIVNNYYYKWKRHHRRHHHKKYSPCIEKFLKCHPGEKLYGQAYYNDPCQDTYGHLYLSDETCGPYYRNSDYGIPYSNNDWYDQHTEQNYGSDEKYYGDREDGYLDGNEVNVDDTSS